MGNGLLFKGMVLGLEQAVNAKYIKTDGFDIFFDVPKGTDMKPLKRAKEAFFKSFGLGIKVRYVEYLKKVEFNLIED